MWKRNESPLLLYHVKRIECRSENHVPKVVLGVLHLEGDQRAAMDTEWEQIQMLPAWDEKASTK